MPLSVSERPNAIAHEYASRNWGEFLRAAARWTRPSRWARHSVDAT